MEWRDLYPEVESDDIIKRIEENWDLDGPLPLPKFVPLCICGKQDWHARLWLFWDRSSGGALDNRIMYRCDMSIKCQHCGQVIIFGIPLPLEWIDYWQPRLDVQIDFRAAKKIFLTMEERDDIERSGWRALDSAAVD